MDANTRFNQLKPLCEKAIKRHLYHLQKADQDDATQVGLIEVWNKLTDPATANNSDSWFIWRASMYAKDYATRLVYRWNNRSEPIVCHDDAGEDTSRINEPSYEGGLLGAEFRSLLATLPALSREIAERLAAGQRQKHIIAELQLSYRGFYKHCREIAQVIRAQ